MILARVAIGALVAMVLVACTSEKTSTGAPKDDSEGPAVVDRPGTCENFSLSFGPVSLPSASKGEAYDVELGRYADKGWYGVVYQAQRLPPGLTVTRGGPSDRPILRGIPTSTGAFELEVYAVHDLDSNGCSTMPDPHKFHLDILDADAGADGAADAGADGD